MTQYINENFAGSSGQELSAYNPAWTRLSVRQAFISNSQRLRTGAGSSAAQYYSAASATHPDGSIDYDVFIASTVSGNAADIYFRYDETANSGYYVNFLRSGTSNFLSLWRRVAGADTFLGSYTIPTVSVSQILHIRAEFDATGIEVFLDGVSRVVSSDSVIYAPGRVLVSVSTPSGGGDAIGYHIDNLVAEDAAAAAADLDVTPVFSQSFTVQPSMTSSGFLSPAAVYSESYAVTPTLEAVTFPMDVVPVFSQFFRGMVNLTPGEATIEPQPVYSEWSPAAVFFATGQTIEPQPVYSEWHAEAFDLIPGPVERDAPAVEFQSFVTVPSVSMELTLNPDPVFGEFYGRRPTLKSRFTCGTLAPLQDRLGARVSKDGRSGCSVGVHGSDGFVKW